MNASTLRAWRARGLLTVDESQHGGWTRYSVADLIRACVLAELARAGVSPGSGSSLVANAELDLSDFATQRADAAGPRYLVAHKLDTDEESPLVVHSGVTAEGLARRIGGAAGCAVAIVIDTAKLWRRIVRTLRDIGEQPPQ